MLLGPKQLAQALAIPGQPLVWNGREWAPDDALRAAVETQGQIISTLIQLLIDERIDVPPELEAYAASTEERRS